MMHYEGQSTYHVSKLLNFFVTTFPRSIPRRSTTLWARSGCEEPLNILILGILDSRGKLRFSVFARNKLLARIASDKTGITEMEKDEEQNYQSDNSAFEAFRSAWKHLEIRQNGYFVTIQTLLFLECDQKCSSEP